jgi:REP element-mobilizing transposase RayT
MDPAYELRYSCTGWPTCPPLPVNTSILTDLKPLWEGDGMRLLEYHWSEEMVQLTFSARPDVSPVVLAGRAKGRLQHALRKTTPDFSGFSRKVSVNAVGHNCREDVEAYIASQVDVACFADPSFNDLLKEFTTICQDIDLSIPTESLHGRYWYNLHLVLVTAERHRIVDRRRLATLHDYSFRVAEKRGHKISRISLMPDHLHAALRGNIEQSPQEIALSFQNNLAYVMGQLRLWTATFYVGSFGEYDMWAIRRKQRPR